MREFRSPVNQITWLAFVNVSGEEIPANALLRITGVDADGALEMDKPDADSDGDLFINGPHVVPEDEMGNCTRDTPIYILYDDADGTPGLLEDWGSEAGSWKLRKDKTGYKTLGGATDGAVIALAAAGGAGSGSLTVRELDADPTIPNVNTLTFDQGNFTVTDETDGEAKVKTKGGTASEVVVAGFDTATCQVTAKTLRFVDGLYQDSV